MENTKPIFWHQGLFLQPQHFQLSEQYMRSQLIALQHNLQPYSWGVLQLNMLETALEQRCCEITSGQFLFNDGSFVTIDDNAIINPRNFEEDWLEADKPFTIYVGLKKLSHHDNNVTVVKEFSNIKNINSRYASKADPEDCHDVYQQSSVAKTKFLHYVLQIIWESELDKYEDMMLIPVAKVIRSDNGISIAKQFCPPVVRIASDEQLVRHIKDIRDDLTGRLTQLQGYDHGKSDTSKFDATLLRYKLATRSLSRYIPKLFHYTEEGNIHPWHVYALIRELIGEISTFTDSVNVLGETLDGQRLLPKYNHVDIGDCFQQAKALLTSLLNEITVGPQFLVEMPKKETLYRADIPQEFFEQSVDFYLIISNQENFEQQQSSLLTTAKLAAFDMVKVLAERSLPGVGLINVTHPPADMPRRPDAHYVRIDTHDEQWSMIERHKDIALLWDEAPEDSKIELVIVRR